MSIPFQEAWSDGVWAFQAGAKLDEVPLVSPLMAAWWRRGWRYACAVQRVEAGLDAMDEAERRELHMDPEFDWEGASC